MRYQCILSSFIAQRTICLDIDTSASSIFLERYSESNKLPARNLPTQVRMTSDLINRVHSLDLNDDVFTAWTAWRSSADASINDKIVRKIMKRNSKPSLTAEANVINDPTRNEFESTAVAATATADLLPVYLFQLVRHYHDDFYISRSFDPQLIVQLMAEGFLPIASKRYLRPKLHVQRCVIQLNPPSKLHISRSTRKKSKSFLISVNECFDEVVAGCHRQQ